MEKRKPGLKVIGILVSLFALIWFFGFYKGTTAPIRDTNGRIMPSSIAKLEKVKINGAYEWLLKRGQNRNNPALLFIHGGPGDSDMILHEKYNKPHEKNFVVVNWDQRRAGKSYYKDTPEASIKLNNRIDS